jgi:hypothetical protein
MATPSWLDDVQKRLFRQGLPPSYVQRFMGELADHLNDLKEENMEADAIPRLGEPEQVAEAAVIAYRRRSFLGRHPLAAFLVFAVSPMIPQILLFMVVGAALRSEPFKRGFETLLRYNEHLVHLICILVYVACSGVISALYAGLIQRIGLGRKWICASSLVLGILPMVSEFVATPDIGLRCVAITAQFVVLLAIGWWLVRRRCDTNYRIARVFIFVISPVASLIVVVSLVYWASRPLFDTLLQVRWENTPMGYNATFLHATRLLKLALASALASVGYCYLGRRSGVALQWTFVSCAVLAGYGAMNSFYVGLGVGWNTSTILVQLMVPLAIGWWFMRRQHDPRRSQLA